jgi:hypothetical protein
MPAIVKWTLVLLLGLAAAPARADCGSAAGDRDGLLALRAAEFAVEADDRRQQLAIGLLECLGEPDPQLRDGVAFAALSQWLRAGLLQVATRDALRLRLLTQLQAPDDPLAVRRSFVVLVLSELARADRLDPQFSVEQRAELVAACAMFLAAVVDHRGFEEGVGWRHQVAHGADWVLQLGLHPQLEAAEVQRLLAALATQIATTASAYTFGEPDRFARAVFFIHQRGVRDNSQWQAWFDRLIQPAPFSSWREAGESEAGLRRRHNLDSFLRAVHFAATVREGEEDVALRRQALRAIEALGA